MAERYLGHEMLVIGPGTKTGMGIRYDNPREIGADRLVNAVAIRERYGGGPSVCVDFGTATTFDVVSAAGEYLGGTLMTGIEISLEALSERGARLPKVGPGAPEGRDRAQHDRRDQGRGGLRLRRSDRRDPAPPLRRSSANARTWSRRAAWRRSSSPTRRRSPRSTTSSRSPGCASSTSETATRRHILGAVMSERPLGDPWLLGGVRVPNRVLLAPLAGIGNWFVRLQAKRYGAGMAVSEMVSSHAIHYGNRRTLQELLRIDPREREPGPPAPGGPVSIQLFGPDPAIMRSAAAEVARAGADVIDLNMGCPVPKVCKTGAGAALLSDPDRAVAIARAARAGSGLPVTVKLRCGRTARRPQRARAGAAARRRGAA